MGKILLVEPLRILQQAVGLTLYPDHEVHVQENIGAADAPAWTDYELVILDGTALRDLGRLTPELIRAVQAVNTPILWLGEDENHELPRRANLVVIKKPLEREAFHSAVADLLSPGGAKREGNSAVASTPDAGSHRSLAKKAAEGPAQESFGFIDLVDVVEPEGSGGQKKKSSGKPK
ncbi:MAG: hypothetical protein HYV04_18155 [Deltaproteobacteria bacterium]|nr:hypothetical protein [Deltaproteobacteria bacterium]